MPSLFCLPQGVCSSRLSTNNEKNMELISNNAEKSIKNIDFTYDSLSLVVSIKGAIFISLDILLIIHNIFLLISITSFS